MHTQGPFLQSVHSSTVPATAAGFGLAVQKIDYSPFKFITLFND